MACDRNLAFEWTNLNLTCSVCNNTKESHDKIPVNSTLNPCQDSDEIIEEHLSFENEQIAFRTPKGKLTIQKYRLDREDLELLRSKELILFYQRLDGLREKAMLEKRMFTNSEIDELRRFARADYPFSLMFRTLLKKKGIL